MEDKDLIFELENGRKLDVVFIGDKKYSMNLLGLHEIYPNLNVKVLEKNNNYMDVLEEMNNIDIIINYHEEKEDIVNLAELQRLAFSSSNDKHRTTVGYTQIDPYEYGLDYVMITSYKDGLPTMIEFEIDNEYTPYDLLQITLNEHDNLNKEKVLVI